MFFRISERNIRRTPGKTLLFSVLITALTLLLFLCVYTYAQSLKMSAYTEESYITIAALEMSDAGTADIDYSILTGNRYVADWQPNIQLDALSSFDIRTNDGGDYKNMAVLVVGGLFYDSHLQMYVGTVYRQLSGNEDVEGNMILVSPGASGFSPESGRKYIMNCEFAKSPSSLKAVVICPVNFGGSLADVLPFEPLDDADAYLAAEDGIFFKAAKFYNTVRSLLVVCPVRSLDSNLLFHQQTLYLTAGRGFSKDEFSAGEKVCVISEKFAEAAGLSVGSTIPLFISSSSVGDGSALTPENQNKYEDYTVAGLMHAENELANYIFVPEKAVAFAPSAPSLKYGLVLGQAVLKNGSGDDFLASLAGRLPDNVTLTVYDHGYGAIKRVTDSMLNVTLVLSVVSAIACAAVLALYGYLFVARQRDTVTAMVCLGTPKRGILTYLLSGSALISLAASAAGGVIGTLAGPAMFKTVLRLFSSLSETDNRFSNTSVGVIIDSRFSAGFSLPVSIFVPLSVFAVSLVFCIISSSAAFDRKKKSKTRRAARLPKPPKRSSLLPPSPFRYSLLSIRRGRMRSLAVPALAAVMTVFLCTVAYSADAGERRISEIYSDTVIRGHITDLSGKMTRNISVNARQLETLAESGYFDNISPSVADSYMYLGVAQYADGGKAEEINFTMPSGFALSTFIDNFYLNPAAVFTKSLSMAQGFTSSGMSVIWGTGYGPEDFSTPDWVGNIPCIVTKKFADEKKVTQGDIIRIILTGNLNKLGKFNIVDAAIAGICENAAAGTGSETIWFPLVNTLERVSLPPSEESALLSGTTLTPEHFLLIFGGRNYSSVYFTLRDAAEINAVKQYLADSGYSYTGHVGTIRMSVQLEDKQFYENLRPVRQQTQYMNLLFPLLFAVSAAVGTAVSALMIGARREEIAVMRGTGATCTRTFLSFFGESAILAVTGAAAGWLLFLPSAVYSGPRLCICMPGFILCYLAGAAVSVTSTCRKKIMNIIYKE
jgi:ABC-type lipoprotein release transport system permease subunit